MLVAVDEVERYLVKNMAHLDLILEQVVILLPESYFYKPEIKEEYFLSIRQELDLLRRQSLSVAYRYDKRLLSKYIQLNRKYEEELKKVSAINRQKFLEDLLVETEEITVICLYNLIRYYKLLKHLRTFNQ